MRTRSQSTAEKMRGTFMMFDRCPHCHKELKCINVNLFGKQHEVTCYGSCGCDKSKLDGLDVKDSLKQYARVGIPTRYLGAEADLQGYDFDVASGKSLYIHGPYGDGKTHFACALAKSLVDMGQYVRFENSKRIITEIQGTYAGGATDVMDRCYNCKVLFLDDLGKEQPTAYSISMLYEVIDARYAAAKPMVVTSNFARDELLARWANADFATAESIVSRLCDNVDVIYMDGPDRRLS